MKVEELKGLVATGEDETLEFKRSTGQCTRAMETLCGMLNGKGGSVVHDGERRTRDQKERQPQLQPQSQPQLGLKDKILALLKDEDLSTMQLSAALGQQQRSGHLRESLRALHQEGLIAFTLPDKPSSRLQKHRLTERGRKAGGGHGK